jgi:pimeloyl-ACP methyl ester carboxylesterase
VIVIVADDGAAAADWQGIADELDPAARVVTPDPRSPLDLAAGPDDDAVVIAHGAGAAVALDHAAAGAGCRAVVVIAPRGPRLEALPRVTCPVLIVQGLDDDPATLDCADQVRRRVAGPVRTVLLSRCGAAPHLEQPATTLAEIRAFVDAVGR